MVRDAFLRERALCYGNGTPTIRCATVKAEGGRDIGRSEKVSQESSASKV